ncbi:hypothetical protein JHK84_048096 [Glycine max]|nr:hypothetical protein JHK84_048096 [Glycine max]
MAKVQRRLDDFNDQREGAERWVEEALQNQILGKQNSLEGDAISGSRVCINDALTDDDVLPLILGMVERQEDKESFGLVCKRWLHLQSTEMKKITTHEGS